MARKIRASISEAAKSWSCVQKFSGQEAWSVTASSLNIDIITHDRLQSSVRQYCADFTDGTAIVDQELFVAFALLAVTADANFNAGRNFSCGKSDYVIAETGAFTGGNSEGGKGHKDAVGADDLQQLPLMDVFGIDLLIVDDGAQARTGKSDLGLRVFTLEQISMQTCCQSVTAKIIQSQQSGKANSAHSAL